MEDARSKAILVLFIIVTVISVVNVVIAVACTRLITPLGVMLMWRHMGPKGVVFVLQARIAELMSETASRGRANPHS